MSASSHPRSSSAGEHGSTPKGPDEKRRRRPASAQYRVTKPITAEQIRERVKQQSPSAQDRVTEASKAERTWEWMEHQSPSAQDQVTKPPEAKQKPERIEQQPLSAQDQATTPPEAEHIKPGWIKQLLPESKFLQAVPLEEFLNAKYGDQYYVVMRYDQYILHAPEPMTDAELSLVRYRSTVLLLRCRGDD